MTDEMITPEGEEMVEGTMPEIKKEEGAEGMPEATEATETTTEETPA